MDNPVILPKYGTNADTLVQLIEAAASGALKADAFVRLMLEKHEALEREGGAQYGSPEQAKLIWDVIWAVTYYAPDPNKAPDPDDVLSLQTVMEVVQKTAAKMAAMG